MITLDVYRRVAPDVIRLEALPAPEQRAIFAVAGAEKSFSPALGNRWLCTAEPDV